MTSSSVEDGRSIDLTLTDLRDSVWKGITPHESRKQIDWTLKNILITDSASLSLTNLENKISALLAQHKVKDRKSYEICNPDAVRITLSNIGDLVNEDYLVLFDKNQTTSPIDYTRKCNTVPHTRVVTDQEGKFHGSVEHNLAAFALAELVDNSLGATVDNKGKRIIDIRFYENGKHSSLAILDNGCGMSSETLNASLIFKQPKETRLHLPETGLVSKSPENEEEQKNEDIHPLHLNSNISKFGAGMKQAVFSLGNEPTLMTKRAGIASVCEVLYSKKVMEELELSKDDRPWQVPFLMRKSTQRKKDDDETITIKELVLNEEVDKQSFTHILIQDLKPSQIQLLLRKPENNDNDPKCTSIEKQLSHIHHYYIHGRNGNTGERDERREIRVEIRVTRLDSRGKVVSSLNLRDLEEDSLDLESKCVRTAAPDPFLFTVEVIPKFQSKSAHTFKVGGIIRYHPFLYDHETNPVEHIGFARNRLNESAEEDAPDPEEDVDSSDGHSPSLSFKNTTSESREFFQLWWNGRLLPLTRLEALSWCSPDRKDKNKEKLLKSYARISGSLFLDSNISDITDTKSNLTQTATLMEMFNAKAIHQKQCTLQRIRRNRNNNNLEVESGRVNSNVQKSFETWLFDCKKYDKEVLYSELGAETNFRRTTYVLYGNAVWHDLKLDLKVGDAVKLAYSTGNGATNVFGRVKSFLVERGNCLSKDHTKLLNGPMRRVHAPESWFEVELRPAPYYNGEEIRRMEMGLIDKTMPPLVAESLLLQQFKDLELRLKLIKEMEPRPLSGATVRTDETLFTSVGFDVVKQNGDSVHGFLPHYMSTKAKKAIYLITRVHRLKEDGTRELYYTGAICNYLKGYYFKTLDFRRMRALRGPIMIGNYVITFRSYIAQQSQRSNGSASPTEASSSPRKSMRSSPRSCVTMPSANIIDPVSPRRASSVTERITSARPPPTLNDDGSDPAFEIEWEQEVDSLGRKILRDGDNKIRMPFMEIFFSVVAGPPHNLLEFEFDDEDLPLRIGKPFRINLSFTDVQGNISSLDGLSDSLTSQKPNIILVSKRDDLQLTFNCGESFVVQNKLVIKDVVAKGYLLGSASKECKIQLEMKLDKTSTTSRLIYLHSGLPERIVCLDKSITVENGCRPILRAHLVDCSDNVQLLQETNKKPIVLCCNIYKANNGNNCGTSIRRTTVLASDSDGMECNDMIFLTEFKADVRGGVSLTGKISCEEYPNLPPVQVLIKVVSSTRPVKLVIYGSNDQDAEPEAISDESEYTGKIGETLHLSYELFDGFNQEVKFDRNKHSINISWSGKQVKNGGSGILTKYVIPTRSKNRKRMETKLTINDGYKGDLHHIFYLTSHPLEPTNLDLSFVGDVDNNVDIPLGQNPPDIIAKLKDRYGNVITDIDHHQLSPEVQICVDELSVRLETTPPEQGTDASFMIRNLRLQSPPLGKIELTATYKQQFQTALICNIIPGLPYEFVFVINGEKQHPRGTYIVQNKSTVRVCAHLSDEYGNITQPQNDTEVSLSLRPKEDWFGAPLPDKSFMLKRNGDGIADFGVIVAGVKPKQDNLTPSACRIKGCTGKCYGIGKSLFFAQIHAEIGDTTIKGFCHFHFTRRSDTPHKLDPVQSGGNGVFSYEAGSAFEYLTVTLEAEDGSKFITAEKEHLSLHLTSPSVQLEVPAHSVHEGVYTFDKVPTKAGTFKTEFKYHNPTANVTIIQEFSEDLRILPGNMASFGPEVALDNVSVSNDAENPTNRIIVRNLKLQLKDQYGNPVLNPVHKGLVHLAFSEGMRLENHTHYDSPLSLINELIIPELMVQWGLDLGNNTQHFIKFTAILEDDPSSQFSYQLNFTFYNDVRHLQEIQKLEKEIAAWNSELTMTEATMTSLRQEMETLQHEQRVHKAQEIQEKTRLSNRVPANILETLNTSDDIKRRQNVLRSSEKRVQKERGNTASNIQPWPGAGAGEPEVLGPIGLLAEIKSANGNIGDDIKVQRVLSWHLQRKLEIVIVETRARSLQLRKQHPSKEFLMLEVMMDLRPRNFNLSGFPGNPVFARDYLQFKNNSIRKVFNKYLGNTIIMDDLDKATEFMYNHNKSNNFPCPTILTRDGQSLGNDAVIGGSSNSVPDGGNRLHFGIAQSPEMSCIQEELGLLHSLKEAMLATEQAEGRNRGKLGALKTKFETMETEFGVLTEKRFGAQEKLEGLKMQFQNQRTSEQATPTTLRTASTRRTRTPLPVQPVEVGPNKRPRRY